ICFTTIVFVPAMVGLAIGLVYSHGLAMLWQFPLLAAFLLMVTALTYQFQGWLAALMSNPRRRRTVIVIATALLIVLAQLPNLINILRPWDRMVESPSGQIAGEAELHRRLAAEEITREEYQTQRAATERRKRAQSQETNLQEGEQVEHTVRLISTVLPPGWLAIGTTGAAEGSVTTPLLCTLGLTLIGSASPYRASPTTIRLHTA